MCTCHAGRTCQCDQAKGCYAHRNRCNAMRHMCDIARDMHLYQIVLRILCLSQTGSPSPRWASAITKHVLGPYTAYAAATCSLPFLPTSSFPGQMPKMLPTAKLAPTMLLPSSGSKPTCKPKHCFCMLEAFMRPSSKDCLSGLGPSGHLS